MLAAIYARVSTEEQVKGFSLDAQLEACSQKASSLGVLSVELYTDAGVPGTILQRPGLTSARERIRQGGVSYFICLDPDRLARNLSHQLLVTEEIERHGTRLEFVNFDWKDTPEGKLFYSLRGAISEYEREKIRERSMRGKLAKARQNKLTHNPQPYGYDFDKETDSLVINTEKASVVKQVFFWFINEPDAGLHTIANRLTDMYIPTPKGRDVWSKTTIRRILANETYTGTLYQRTVDASGVKGNRFKKEAEKVKRKPRPREDWIPVEVPSIIDKDLFQKAQTKLHSIRKNRPGRAKYDYLLSGLLVCGLCGTNLRGNSISTQNSSTLEKVYTYYTCAARSRSKDGAFHCRAPSVRADILDNEVWKMVLNFVTSPDLVREHEQAILKEEQLAGNTQADMIKARLVELKAKRQKSLNLFDRNLISIEELESRLAADIEQAEKLEEILAQFTSKNASSASPYKKLEFLDRIGITESLFLLTPRQKKNIVYLLVSQIVVTGNQVKINAKTPLIPAE